MDSPAIGWAGDEGGMIIKMNPNLLTLYLSSMSTCVPKPYVTV